VSESAAERQHAVLLTALARVLVVALIFVGERLRVDDLDLTFDLILAIAGVYAIATLAGALLSSPTARPGIVTVTLDLGFLGALTYASAGDLSTVRRAFFLVPVLAAFTQAPRTTALLALAAPGVFVGAALAEGSGEIAVGTNAAFLLLVGAVSVAIAKLLADREGRIRRLVEESRTLTARAIDAEESERRRLSYAIHDEPIQQLLGARLAIGRATRGDRSAAREATAAIDEALRGLRELTSELHPYTLEQLGLSAALEQLAEGITDRTGAEVAVDVTTDGIDEERIRLCFAITRELMRNAEAHADASRIEVGVAPDRGGLRIIVRDDGKGMPAERPAEALREGHIGLGTVLERARAVGGSAAVTSSTRKGTIAEVILPDGRPG
jgi:two-component system, NarL family, sensor kinase